MKRPHIVVVFADQLRYDSLGCTGNPIVRTPNIDRLAREGVVLDNAFSSAPICGPFRAQLLTGNYLHHNGVICNEYRLRDDQRTIAHHLGSQGYRTAYVGKWHLGYGPYYEHKRYGFDDLLAYNCTHNYYDVSYWHNQDGPIRMAEYAPRTETQLAIDYLRQHATVDQPVCLFLSWGPPHWNGLNKERRYGDYPQEFATYDPQHIQVPQNVPDALKPYARGQLADYYGMISSLDECVGTLADAMQSIGIADDTIVVFTSDHGDTIGSHGYLTPADTWAQPDLRLSKGVPFDEACRIPFIVRWPAGLKRMQRRDFLFGSADIAPTLASLVGTPPLQCGGTDCSAAIAGDTPGPDSVYFQILGPGWPTRSYPGAEWRGIRTRHAAYAEWHEPADRRLLLDSRTDPLELRNLAGSPGHAELESRMAEMLDEWIAATGDPFRTGSRLEQTQLLDVGQALVTEIWHQFAHPEIASLSAKNTPAFRTGEQASDPVKPDRVGW